MANSYFQFKQFRVEQDRCAMKVCTDSCLFGAYVPVEHATSILDIGTGTGLLALMAAQRSTANIQAIEIDSAAAQQAAENFSASPWSHRIALTQTSLQDFEQINQHPFDVILCNPPFYLASQKSPDAARNRALHATTLPFADLLRFAQQFLAPGGALYVLLPPHEAQQFCHLASAFSLYGRHQLLIYTHETGKPIRSILRFQSEPGPSPAPTETICIRQTDQQYTLSFRQMLQHYYMIF